jgi:hypothetical protein
MAANHRLGLVDQLFARGYARSQFLLVPLELTRLAISPAGSVVFVGDGKFLLGRTTIRHAH